MKLNIHKVVKISIKLLKEQKKFKIIDVIIKLLLLKMLSSLKDILNNPEFYLFLHSIFSNLKILWKRPSLVIRKIVDTLKT